MAPPSPDRYRFRYPAQVGNASSYGNKPQALLGIENDTHLSRGATPFYKTLPTALLGIENDTQQWRRLGNNMSEKSLPSQVSKTIPDTSVGVVSPNAKPSYQALLGIENDTQQGRMIWGCSIIYRPTPYYIKCR